MSGSRQRVIIFLNFGVLIFASCFLFAFGDDAAAEEEDDTGRQMREYMPETWHAVQTIPEGATGWIPRDPVDSQGTIYTKRRRLRKRKRRPPIVSYLDQNADIVAQINQDFREEAQQVSKDVNLSQRNTGYRTGENEHPLENRRKKPNTGDPWEELQEENIRPYKRRKDTPAYQSDDLTITSNYNPLSVTIQFGPESASNVQQDEYSKNISVVKKEDRFDEENEDISFISPSTTTNKSPKLKEILKKNGKINLSEILQQNNITLTELLMGKKEAIKTLTDISGVVSSTTHSPYLEHVTLTTQKNPILDNSDTTKYKRLPPSIALRKENINRQYTELHESLSDKEMMEAQRKRLSLLQSHSYKSVQNGKFSEVTRYEVITEPTTEKRIFVPSHPKLYTSVDYKPDLQDLKPSTESALKIETTTEKSISTSTQSTELISTNTHMNKTPKLEVTESKARLPITSAKLMKMTVKESTTPSKYFQTTTMETFMEEENYPKESGLLLKPFKIDVKDLYGFQSTSSQPKQKVSDEPLHMSIDLDTIVELSTPKMALGHTSVTTPIATITSTETSTSKITTVTQDIPKLKPYTAKEEILEILKDPLGRAGLARILEARNMTIQELIEQRERGSSQLHLADIFHNKTREPEPSDDALEGQVSSEIFTNFPIFARRPKNLANNEISSEKPTENTSQYRNLLITAFPSFKIEVPKEPLKTKDTFPWQQLYPDLFRNQNQDNGGKPTIALAGQHVLDKEPSRTEPASILTEEDIQRLEDLDQSLYSSISNEQPTIVEEDPEKMLDISTGVKSAIVASLAIVMLSIIVFVTILFVFRWTQRKKRRLHYGDSLKPPLFDVKPKNIKTFVAETLGKKKINYYKRHFQSMSDDGWEKENERKDVF